MLNKKATPSGSILYTQNHRNPSNGRKSGASNLLLAFLALILLGILIAGLAAAGWWWFADTGSRIPSGTSVAGLSIGELSPQAAAERLDKAWNGRVLTLSDGTHTWQTSPAFLGLWMDPAATLQQRRILPSAQLSWDALEERWNPALLDLKPVVRFDREVAESQLGRWGEQVSQPAKNAEVRLENGRAVAVPGQEGSALDLPRTLDAIAADPQAVLASQVARVYFKPVAPQVSDVSAQAAQANALLNVSLGGELYDPITDEKIPWQVPAELASSWMSLQSGPDGYTAVIDHGQVAAYVAELPKHVDLGPERTIDAPSDPHAFAEQVIAGQAPAIVVRYLPTEYTVEKSETLLQVGWKVGMQLWRLQQANPNVNSNALQPGQKLVIPAKTDLLPLPVVVNKRIVISIAQQRMWVYEDGEQIREFVVSTGIANSPTQPGVYQVQTHDVNAYASNWDLWMPHWMGIYEAWPGFMNGIHGLPMLSSGVRLWANVLGQPASYGCIILNLENAEWLYNWAENGVVVEIQA